jgi:phospholipid transport system substrate-binding protein
VLAAFALSLFSSVAWAGPAKQTELFKLLEKNDAASKKSITAIFDEIIDYQALSESSLGAEWKTLKPEQQKEFVGLMKQLVAGAYEKNLRKVLPFDISYLGDDGKVVKTKATHKTDKREEPIEINFKLGDKGSGKYQITDIITEDVSLVDNYRSQFTAIIKKDGFAGLVTKMKDKIAKGQ